MHTKSRGIDMTAGSLWKNIFLFSLPLMFSQILEVLFNLSDVAIAGKFAGYQANFTASRLVHRLIHGSLKMRSPLLDA